MEPIKARLPKNQTIHNAQWPEGSKEQTDAWTVVVRTADGLKTPVKARCFMSRAASASTVYACVWVHGNGYSLSGRGKASGYGYHKESVAIDEAIVSAGIKLSESINGAGDAAIEEALIAITRALGYKGRCIVVRQ